MSVKSNQSRKPGKAATTKPDKPYDGFPLFPHATGRWAKKIKGKLHYFGYWRDQQENGWQAAIDLYNEQKEDLYAGRKPRSKSDELTLRDLCNRFLTAKEHQFETGEIVWHTFVDYKKTTDRLIRVFGAERLVEDLAADDFAELRRDIAKTRGVVSLGNEITRVRVVFNFAHQNQLINQSLRYGSAFKRPSKKVLRKERHKNGKRMFEATEIRAMIDEATVSLKAMILLAINCGFGNADCGTLPMRSVDLDSGWIDYPRPKTGIERRCPLWPETIEALRAVVETRQLPKDRRDANLVFLTVQGQSWAKQTSDNPVTKETRKLLDSINTYVCKKCKSETITKAKPDATCAKCDKKLGKAKSEGIHRQGLGFYALRHTFRTIADATRDFPAVNHIMGHSDDTMGAVYRETISDDRLHAVVDHVHEWLFAKPEADGGNEGEQPKEVEVEGQGDRPQLRIVG